MEIQSSGEVISGIETLRSLFNDVSAEYSDESAICVQLCKSLSEFDEVLAGSNTRKQSLAASRLLTSANIFLQKFSTKASLVSPAINGITAWINDEQPKVPRKINLVLLQHPGEVRLEHYQENLRGQGFHNAGELPDTFRFIISNRQSLSQAEQLTGGRRPGLGNTGDEFSKLADCDSPASECNFCFSVVPANNQQYATLVTRAFSS